MSESSESTTNDIKALREQLNSVAWVQCDNTSCLKWRKIDRGDAEKLANTSWQCYMNKDTNFNACSKEQEDTIQYDKLAKKAKLSVIKSELRPGSLVWAKTTGYSSWPALITKDPANAEYFDGDEVEILWYHVEYIGGKRCHGWVRSSRVETFGIGKLPDIPTNVQRKKTKRRKKMLLTNHAKLNQRDKQSYRGQQTVQEAYEEAMNLLPLSCEARLKTCVFTSRSANGSQRYKKKEPRTRPLMVKGCNTQVIKEEPEINTKPSLKGMQHRKVGPSNSKKRDENNVLVLGYVSPTSSCLKYQVQDCSSKASEKEGDLGGEIDNDEAKELSKNILKVKSTLEPFFDFSSSLIDVSKESRLMADAEKYRTQSLHFEANLTKFFLDHDLPDCKAPVWCYLKISLFEFFLNVFERGGFLTVTARHQWSSVYQELTHQHSKDGGSKTKAFYRKNLYPYELYIQAKDYICALEDKMKSVKQRKGQKRLSFSHQCNAVDENDLMKELEELDDFLESAIEGTAFENKVTDLETDSHKELTCSDSQFSPHIFACEKTGMLAEATDCVSYDSQRFLDATVQKASPGRLCLSSKIIDSVSENVIEEDTDLENTQEWTIHELQLLEHFFH